MPKTYIIRDVPADVHTRLSAEAQARGLSLPNLIRRFVSLAYNKYVEEDEENGTFDWPTVARGNHGANAGKPIKQPKRKSS